MIVPLAMLRDRMRSRGSSVNLRSSEAFSDRSFTADRASCAEASTGSASRPRRQKSVLGALTDWRRSSTPQLYAADGTAAVAAGHAAGGRDGLAADPMADFGAGGGGFSGVAPPGGAAGAAGEAAAPKGRSRRWSLLRSRKAREAARAAAAAAAAAATATTAATAAAR